MNKNNPSTVGALRIDHPTHDPKPTNAVVHPNPQPVRYPQPLTSDELAKAIAEIYGPAIARCDED